MGILNLLPGPCKFPTLVLFRLRVHRSVIQDWPRGVPDDEDIKPQGELRETSTRPSV